MATTTTAPDIAEIFIRHFDLDLCRRLRTALEWFELRDPVDSLTVGRRTAHHYVGDCFLRVRRGDAERAGRLCRVQ